jgi:hypothetical protein
LKFQESGISSSSPPWFQNHTQDSNLAILFQPFQISIDGP